MLSGLRTPGMLLVSGGSAWQPQAAFGIQQDSGELLSPLQDLQQSIGFTEVVIFLLNQVFYHITFIEFIMAAQAVSCFQKVRFVLLIGNLLS